MNCTGLTCLECKTCVYVRTDRYPADVASIVPTSVGYRSDIG